jgi:hypothetical protein
MIGLTHSALKHRHREPRSGVAIQYKGSLDCFAAAPARNDGV